MNPSIDKNSTYLYSQEYNLTSQLKSWMAINPGFGCIWDCAYCIQHKDKFFNDTDYKKVRNITSVDNTVSEIMANPRITSSTPLALYNFSDPFLPNNTLPLRQILESLDDRGFTNIVGMITRTYADSKTLDTIQNLKNLRPIVLVTYAGYEDKDIESAPASPRIRLLKELKNRDIKSILYLRPLVQEWVKDGQIQRVRDETGEYIDGVVMSGIRLTPEIITKIESRDTVVPYVKNHTNKYFPKVLQNAVIDIFKNVAPVHRYTSCGVSTAMSIPDFNAHLGFFKKTQGADYSSCPLPCKVGQSKICSKCATPPVQKIESLLKKINLNDVKFREVNGTIELDREVSKYDLTFLRHNTSCHFDYTDNKHHVDQVAGLNVKSLK